MARSGYPPHDLIEPTDDPLVVRLASVRWPRAPESVRERCWARAAQRLAEVEGRRAGAEPEVAMGGRPGTL